MGKVISIDEAQLVKQIAERDEKIIDMVANDLSLAEGQLEDAMAAYMEQVDEISSFYKVVMSAYMNGDANRAELAARAEVMSVKRDHLYGIVQHLRNEYAMIHGKVASLCGEQQVALNIYLGK